MLNKFRSAMSNVMGGISGLPLVAGGAEDREAGARSPGASSDGSDPGPATQVKYKYNRPAFLQLNEDEVQVSADNAIRPIIVPRDVSKLPWNAGYAEVINAGKTKLNEDQSRAGTMFVPRDGEDVPMSPTPSDDWDEEALEEKFDCVDIVEVGQGPHATNTTTTQKAKPRAMSEVSSEIDMLMTDRKKHSWTGGILPSNDPIPFTYFAIFDGHAGSGAAVMAVNCLHKHIQVQLGMMRDLLLAKRYNLDPMYLMAGSSHIGLRDKTSTVSLDDLVTGALEKAFKEMDEQISQERLIYKIIGGCTAIVALFFMGKLYVANAGDCRAVMCRGDDVFPMSTDFTPESERARVQLVGSLRPELLHREFSYLEFPRRVTPRDIGKKMLYKDAGMKGWAYKVIMDEDTKFPLVHGEGKKARLLATIGVTRGFGDHDLRVYESDIYVKPFMSCVPEVQVYDMSSYYHSENDVLIMGSDGLWDVTSNDRAARIVREGLEQFDSDDRARYTSAAQELVMQARGLPKKGWRTMDNKMASGDDITAFVIPLHRYMCTMSESSSTESSVETS